MKRKLLLVVLSVVVIGVLILLLIPSKQGAVWKGNVLFITLDTTRADTLGCYGDTMVKTPNLDRLGNQGIRFENCYTPVPLTLPSHCSIFTGKVPVGHGVRNNGNYYLSEQEKTLAEVFKEKEYSTYAVVAAFVLMSKFGLKQGFDAYDDSLDSHKLLNSYKSEIRAPDIYGKFETWFQNHWERRFFAWIHFYDPHTPYHPPKKFIDIKKVKDQRVLYRGEVSFMDVYVGKLMDLLKEKGVLDDTLVVVVGDHGEAFGEHVEYAGHSIFCYQENLHVPLIIFNRKLFSHSRVVSDRVCTIDIMPTVMELTGSQPPPDIQGRSLVALMRGSHSQQPETLYIESLYGQEVLGWAPLTGIVEGEYKYISLPEPELYNLIEDPGEKNNLVRIKSNVSRKMDKSLAEIISRYSQASGDSKRDLSNQDIDHLKSLGYISAFSGKTKGVVDPKKGIVFNNRVKKISRMVKRGKLDTAEAEIREIMRDHPEMVNYALISQLFSVHLARNDVEAALDSLREGLKLFPEAVNFRSLMAQILYDNHRYQELFKICDEIVKIDPNSTWAYILRGDSYDKLNDTVNALKSYRRALSLEPENISMKIRYAELLLKNQQLGEALKEYNSVLDNYDVWNSPEILYKIALFNASHGTLEKAEELMKRILEIKPEGKYHYMFALILFKNKKLPEALAQMEIAWDRYRDQLDESQQQKAREAINAWKQAL